MAQGKVFVGIDVSKAVLDVEVWPAGERFQVANDREGRADLVGRLRRRGALAIGLEASGGYERDSLRALLEAGLPARRVNPLRVRQFALACGVLAKNDKLDASMIARFVATVPQRQIKPDPAAERLAELVTARRQLREDLTRAQNQAEHAGPAIVQRLSKLRAARLRADILLLDKAIAQAIADDPELARKDALLRSVPGVGPVFAHTLLAQMPELGSLTNRQAAALLGVAPYDHDSGQMKGQRHIWGGRRNVRDVAYMAAMVAGQHNPALKAFRQRLLDAGKRPKVIIVAVMRKLITILNAILRNNSPWDFA